MQITSKLIRAFRKYHKWIGLSLLLLLIISALTGLLLGWKKNAAILQPTEVKHGETKHSTYLSVAEMMEAGNRHWKEAYPDEDNYVARLDIKLEKGIVKLLFEHGYWEAQIHPVDGSLLSLERRNSDWIEALHDGSLISDNFKLIAMTLLGLGLFLLSLSGFYLWYGPEVLRKNKQKA
jgi:uncharacterized iron-regulated membrane protein